MAQVKGEMMIEMEEMRREKNEVIETTLERSEKDISFRSSSDRFVNSGSFTSSPLVSSVFLHLLNSFRVYFYIFSTRFECSITSSQLVSSVVSGYKRAHKVEGSGYGSGRRGGEVPAEAERKS